MAELADAPDLGSGVPDVQVQVLSAAFFFYKKRLTDPETGVTIHVKGDDEDGRDTKRKENRWLVKTGGGRPVDLSLLSRRPERRQTPSRRFPYLPREGKGIDRSR